MQTQLTKKPVEQVVAAILALDLDPIKVKLMQQEEGEGWSREYVDQVEVAYKRFLTLVAKYPEETIAPSKDVDKFWHGHILDTMKYAEDCQNVFGFFLHHFPYFGMRGEQDAANLAEAGRTTRRLYEEEFGATLPSRAAALCGAATKTDSPLCGAAVTVENALCGAATPALCGAAVTADSALCGAAMNDSALCGAARPALCGAAVNDSALCGAAVSANSALCGAAGPALCGAAIERRSALCGAANSVYRDKLNTSMRPKLALAA